MLCCSTGLPKVVKVYCCGCEKDVAPTLKEGADIYPFRPKLAHKLFWQCQHCYNFVGCHKGVDKPLGCIPTLKLKLARRDIHSLLDPLWKTRKLTRSQVYAHISKKLGYSYHTAEIRTILDALRVYNIVFQLGVTHGTN